MDPSGGLPPKEIDDLVAGDGSADEADEAGAAELRRFIERMPSAYSGELTPETVQAHLAAIEENARLSQQGTTRTERAKWVRTAARTTVGLSTVFSTLGAKLAVAAAVVATVGGLAATDHLPHPVQKAVERTMVHFGVHLPGGDSGPVARAAIARPSPTPSTLVLGGSNANGSGADIELAAPTIKPAARGPGIATDGEKTRTPAPRAETWEARACLCRTTAERDAVLMRLNSDATLKAYGWKLETESDGKDAVYEVEHEFVGFAGEMDARDLVKRLRGASFKSASEESDPGPG